MRFVIGFILGLTLSLITVWIGGYDFDTRSVDAAFGFVFIVILSFIVGMGAEST